MKFKASITLIIAGALLISVRAPGVLYGSDSGDFIFLPKFRTLKISRKLKLVRTKTNLDYFSIPIYDCIRDFYHDTTGIKSYDLEDKSKTNRIGITEYIFKDSTAANKAFTIAYAHAESVRKKRRVDFGSLCVPHQAGVFFYASKSGAHVYLYSIAYNFQYYNAGQDSVDTNMQNDKRILLDDIYKEMTGQ